MFGVLLAVGLFAAVLLWLQLEDLEGAIVTYPWRDLGHDEETEKPLQVALCAL